MFFTTLGPKHGIFRSDDRFVSRALNQHHPPGDIPSCEDVLCAGLQAVVNQT